MSERKLVDEILANAKYLEESLRRTLYSKILSSIQNESNLDQNFYNICEAPSVLTNSLVEKWNKIIELINLGYNEFGPIFVWKNYPILCEGEITESLGQYFTKPSIVNFILSGLKNNPKKILDPMAGHGVFLLGALKRFKDAKIIGVDIDDLPLKAAKLVLNNRVKLINQDIFTWAFNRVNENKDFHFDAIVGNPAYISYQNLQKVGDFGNIKEDYRKYIFGILKEIAEMKSIKYKLNRLFKNWSGYSDLAVYTIILSWLLSDDGGQIAFVTTNHWLERNYGENIQRFLTNHGTVHGIVTQRNGNWFPRAQIPTNIIIYTKGEPSKNQLEYGIPHVEIFKNNIDDIKHYLKSIIKEDFWSWINTINEPKTYDNIRVSFKKWFEHKIGLREYVEINKFKNIDIPNHLKNYKLFTFDSIGWEVHQGLRTGCNEVFYVKKSHLKLNKFTSTVTRNGKKVKKTFHLNPNFVIPVIQKITSDAPLKLNLKHTNTYLLNLNNSILSEDIKEIKSKYPNKWIKEWKIEDYHIIPEELAQHLRECASVPYEGKGQKRVPASELSAVRTNVYIPHLKNTDTIPPPPTFWYQIKIRPRHYGKIIIPRVTGGALRSYLIEETKEVLTDANFVTLIPNKEKLPPKYLWVWPNTNTFRLLAEMNGVPLGGGALKLEASIIKTLPVPYRLLKKKEDSIEEICKNLGRSYSEMEILDKGEEIDAVLFDNVNTSSIKTRLEKYIELRQK
ncbi:Eco57I restriction-modification methylase domain-containing protein [Patescibacteria group bacterium]|nr:Eco57I restriction-modification methylase domain-containing protein [Patescibacteria group bacterium]